MKKTITFIFGIALLVACSDGSSAVSSSPSDSTSSHSSFESQSTESSFSSSSPSSSTSESSTSSLSSSSDSSLNINGIGLALFNYLSALPSTESFLPQFMNEETYLTNQTIENLNYYEVAVNKTNLPTRYFGAQLDQLWNHLEYMTSFTNNLTTMMSHASEIGNLYSTYLSGNPTNPYEFNVQLGDFSFSIAGLANELVLEVRVGEIQVTLAVIEMNANIVYWAELYINEDNRLLMYSTANELKIISNIQWDITPQTQARISYLLDITKSGNSLSGYSYERYGIGDVITRNHIVFKSQNGYFSVAGERGDFLPLSNPKINVETYRLVDGAYVGSQVLEDVPDVPLFPSYYETIWYPLWSVNGWSSIRFEEDNEDDMAYPQVYFNGLSTPFNVHFNTFTVFSITQNLDRKYDIELKKSYVYQLDNDGNRMKVEFLYPAFFIQESELSSGPFGTANNRNNQIFSHTLSAEDISNIQTNYDALKPLQAAYKQINVDEVISNLFQELKV